MNTRARAVLWAHGRAAWVAASGVPLGLALHLEEWAPAVFGAALYVLGLVHWIGEERRP